MKLLETIPALQSYDVLVVGSGLSGAVLAERFSTVLSKKVLLIEKRDHIAGNCYDFRDPETGILMSKYGPHLFRTNNEIVWSYVRQFATWLRWEHKVLAWVRQRLVPVPVNMTTVNVLCNESLQTTEEMLAYLRRHAVPCAEITNSEQLIKSRVGEALYELIFRDYTYKQWNKYPHELNPEACERVGVRDSFDDRYFSDKYQALPQDGYTPFVEAVLRGDNVHVVLNTDFDAIPRHLMRDKLVIYTGPIDAYFRDAGLPALEYRSIDFITERHRMSGYYQPNFVVNYPSRDVPYTRIAEYKHIFHQTSEATVIVKEISTDRGDPYYPVPSAKNMEVYERYRQLAAQQGNVHFLGRLANYRYFSMDEAIAHALSYFERTFQRP